MSSKKVALVILDGWGYGNHSQSDAIHHANTPFFDQLVQQHPNTTLRTSGEDVGLPMGQMGNSEVGHLNIGAGRVVYQDLVRINKAIENNEVQSIPSFQQTIQHALNEGKTLHLMGLVSDGGVHSHQNHLHHLIDLAEQAGVKKVIVHAILDGRDTDPKSGLGYLTRLLDHLQGKNAQLGTVIGRYFAMDRDQRWERVKKAYQLYVHNEGETSQDILQTIQEKYDSGTTDEFMDPILVQEGKIQEGDAVICFNFRTDRCREITIALTQRDFPEHDMSVMPLRYVTMTRYDESYKGVHVLFEKDNLSNTLGEVLANANKSQIRIAETEKYPHVTFFFNGGREKEFPGESRIMVNSPKVATYDLQPEMSAPEVTDKITATMDATTPDFICLNYANPDMVGHTGVYSAVTKAVETVDGCLEKVVSKGLEKGYSFIIIADHGNADFVINEDGSPNTAHTTNPVPCILIDDQYTSIQEGKLGDIAPTVLKLMDIPSPEEMSGDVLI